MSHDSQTSFFAEVAEPLSPDIQGETDFLFNTRIAERFRPD
jgi:hypothetical protein